MREIFEDGQWLKIFLVGIVIALLGLYPFPKSVSTSLEIAYRDHKTGNFGSVAANLVRVIGQQPWRIGFWEAAGNAALAAGDTQNAGSYFAQAAAKGELSPDGYIAWGDADWQSESHRTALQIWRIAAGLGISPDEVLERQADAYRVLQDNVALIETLQEMLHQTSIVNRSPKAVSALHYELGLLLAAYDPASAPVHLTKAVELDPDLDPEIRSLIFDIQRGLEHDNPVYELMISGRALANHDYWSLAEKAFENATVLDPEYAEAWAYLGEARQYTASDLDPLVALETALELDPASIAANTFNALFWQRQYEYELALGYFQMTAKLDPDNPVYLVEIGNLVALLGDLDAGEDYYRQAIALSSNDPKYVREFLKFSIQFNLNLHDVALPVARKLVALNPKNPISLDLMGDILLRLGDMFNAERFFLRALAQDPEYDQAHLHLGQLYLSQTKKELAQYHFGRVLEVSTNAEVKARARKSLDAYFSP